MVSVIRRFLVVAVVALVAIGCAQPPQAELEAALGSIEKAAAAGAEEYAAEAYAAARDAQTKLEAELKVQNEAFALTRSYGESLKLAAAATEAGNRAAAVAATQKEAAKTEAAAAVEGAKAAIQAAENAMTTAPKGKGSKADLEALQADINAAKSTLGEADTAVTGEHYLDAKAKADAARQKAAGVTSAIEEAIKLRKGGSRG